MDEAVNRRLYWVLHLRSGFGLIKLGNPWGWVFCSPMPAPQFKWEDPRGMIFSAGHIFLFHTRWKFAECFDMLRWLFIYLHLCATEQGSSAGGRTWDLFSIDSGAKIEAPSSGPRPKL